MAAWKGNAPRPRALDVPRCPPEAWYIWEWFCQLSLERRRSPEGNMEPITSSEMTNWCGLEKVTLKPFELEIIRRLDRLFLAPPKKIEANEEEEEEEDD